MLSFFRRMFGKVGSWFGASTIAHAGVEVAKWGAAKILLAAIWFTGIYILVNNIMVFVMEKISALIPAAYGDVPGQMSPFIIQLTGVGAYLAQKLMLVEGFTVFIAGISLAVIRSLLPWPVGK